MDILKHDARERMQYYRDIIESQTGHPMAMTGRTRHAVIERNLVMYALRREGYTVEAIGRAMERSHCTVMHSVNVIESVIRYPKMYQDMKRLVFSFLERI